MPSDTEFDVIGICDVDGNAAWYNAQKTMNVTLSTGNSVY
jgi:hypothetical protein